MQLVVPFVATCLPIANKRTENITELQVGDRHMKIGPIIVLTWWLIIALTLISAFVAAIRRGPSSLKHTMPMIVGALMLYGFISAGIGISEGVWAITSVGFIITCTIGVLGLLLVVFGFRGFARSSAPASGNIE